MIYLKIHFQIVKNLAQVTTLFFRKFCFNLRTSYRELICCTNNPNAHFCTFCKRWSFIWRCFFPVSILKNTKCNRFFFHLFNTKLCAVPVNYYFQAL